MPAHDKSMLHVQSLPMHKFCHLCEPSVLKLADQLQTAPAPLLTPGQMLLQQLQNGGTHQNGIPPTSASSNSSGSYQGNGLAYTNGDSYSYGHTNGMVNSAAP